jgi:hypothetical protein
MAINLVSLVMQFLTPDMIGRITERPAAASAGLDQSARAKWAVADRGEGSADGTGRTRARMQLKLPAAPRHPRGFALPNEQSVICRSQIASGRDDGTQTELERQQWLEM